MDFIESQIFLEWYIQAILCMDKIALRLQIHLLCPDNQYWWP